MDSWNNYRECGVLLVPQYGINGYLKACGSGNIELIQWTLSRLACDLNTVSSGDVRAF